MCDYDSEPSLRYQVDIYHRYRYRHLQDLLQGMKAVCDIIFVTVKISNLTVSTPIAAFLLLFWQKTKMRYMSKRQIALECV
jgi:hypothetical protein